MFYNFDLEDYLEVFFVEEIEFVRDFFVEEIEIDFEEDFIFLKVI